MDVPLPAALALRPTSTQQPTFAVTSKTP